MLSKKYILQANLNNQGGAFSVAYEAQKELKGEYVFDYYSPNKPIKNDVYKQVLSIGGKFVGALNSNDHLLKQYIIYKEFYKYLCENNYEIVHIHADTAWKISVYYLAAKKAKVKKIVVHSHSSGINGHYQCVNYLLHLLAKPIIKKADIKCACSDIAAKWMFDTTDNVTIIRNGVDINKFTFNQEARDKIRKELNIEDKIVIGSVSDFSPQKNPRYIYDLVKAFKDNPKYTFLFVGNRQDKCDLKELIDRDTSIRNVIFAGAVTNVQDYLSAMDIFVLPSKFEGLPMCALEAQVNGLHTIISNKVTSETKCSSRFEILPLDVETWKQSILNVDLSYDRNNQKEFLDINKASSANMADEFRKIYEDK